MKRDEWNKSHNALRSVLRAIRKDHIGGSPSRWHNYKFAYYYLQSRKIFLLYNAKARNLIATVKYTNNDTVVRYRANSFYADIIKSYCESRGYTCVASTRLFRHSGYARREFDWLSEVFRSGVVDESGVYSNNTIQQLWDRPPTVTMHTIGGFGTNDSHD